MQQDYQTVSFTLDKIGGPYLIFLGCLTVLVNRGDLSIRLFLQQRHSRIIPNVHFGQVSDHLFGAFLQDESLEERLVVNGILKPGDVQIF